VDAGVGALREFDEFCGVLTWWELEVLAVAWAKNWGVAMLAMFMLYGWRLGDVWLAGDGC